jgi:hypothetical protein
MARPRQSSKGSEASPAASPTLPLPPPRAAASISLDQFIEAVSASALRALANARELNPQPLPPKEFPKPWIWMGIVASYGDLPSFAGGPNVAGKAGGQ